MFILFVWGLSTVSASGGYWSHSKMQFYHMLSLTFPGQQTEQATRRVRQLDLLLKCSCASVLIALLQHLGEANHTVLCRYLEDHNASGDHHPCHLYVQCMRRTTYLLVSDLNKCIQRIGDMCKMPDGVVLSGFNKQNYSKAFHWLILFCSSAFLK